jgi:hypothetical protein
VLHPPAATPPDEEPIEDDDEEPINVVDVVDEEELEKLVV